MFPRILNIFHVLGLCLLQLSLKLENEQGEAQWKSLENRAVRKRHIKTLLWVDNEKITERQTKMSNRVGEYTIYKEDFRFHATLPIFLEIERPAVAGNHETLHLI